MRELQCLLRAPLGWLAGVHAPGRREPVPGGSRRDIHVAEGPANPILPALVGSP
jgi:hypothetical protein